MSWLLFNSGRGDAAFNMALDEALLTTAPVRREPVLRFYGWTEPAATFGYFQKYSEVAQATRLRPLIRRPTGGGLVPHDGDWTYSVVFPPDHEWYSLRAQESYQCIHDWLRRAFDRLKIQTQLAPDRLRTQPGTCFAGHEQHDLLWNGKKIAGAAQRRNKSGLLIQGSVHPPSIRIPRGDWELAMAAAAEAALGASWRVGAATETVQSVAIELAAGKFSRREYNQMR